MVLLTAPIRSESGYGHKSREIALSLLELMGDDLFIGVLQWGMNPDINMEEHPKWNKLYNHVKNQGQLTEIPDLHIHVGIPTDFQPQSRRCILFTSGVEVDRIPAKWIEIINNSPIEKVIVPSTFVKNVFESSIYTTNQNGQHFKITKPIEVVPESYDESMFDELHPDNEFVNEFETALNGRKFLFSAGQWVPNPYDSSHEADRKNFKGLIRAYTTYFDRNTDFVLVLKLNSIDYSLLSDYHFQYSINNFRNTIPVDVEDRPKIMMIRADLTPNEMFYLLSHPNNMANIFLTHGEGFGRFILEASMSKNPLIVPEHGAFRDFTINSLTTYIEGNYGVIPDSSVMPNILERGSNWFYVNEDKVKHYFKKLVRNGKSALLYEASEIEKEVEYLKSTYSFDSVKEKIKDVVKSSYTKKVEIQLPKLKMIPRLKPITANNVNQAEESTKNENV